MLEITYTLQEDAPSFPTYQQYDSYLKESYAKLLDNHFTLERQYQSFFESHPCMLPGHSFGNQNHGVPNWSLVSQPIIGSDIRRIPDFMWLTETSTELIPVLIEIEVPDKAMYRKSDSAQSALYSQALNQIEEWRVILEEKKERNAFFDRYEISKNLASKRKFSPRFILIYGRRKEFCSDKMLAIKRANKQQKDFNIMSFDRLSPSFDAMRYATTKYRSSGQIDVLAVPPTFQLGPMVADCLAKWNGLDSAIERCTLMSQERKAFLMERAGYWRDWIQSGSHALRTGDWE